MKKLTFLALGAALLSLLAACESDHQAVTTTTTTEETVSHPAVVAPVTSETRTVRTY